MKASLLRHILNLWPPFSFAGVHVTDIADDYRHARVELRMRPWNRNYVGFRTPPFVVFDTLTRR